MAQAQNPVRYGTMVAPGKSATLDGGQWDFEDTGYLKQANAVRLELLKTAKRLNDQNVEIQLARVSNRSPKIPDPVARQSLIKADRDRVAALRKTFDEIESQVFGMEVGLKPYDYPESIRDAMVSAQLRDRLFNAQDDKARAKLLELAPYRKAAFEAPAEASGVSKLAYDRLRSEDIARRYPVETKTIADFRKAEEIVDHVFKAVDTGLKHEMVASGAASIEQQQNIPEPESKAWA